MEWVFKKKLDKGNINTQNNVQFLSLHEGSNNMSNKLINKL